MRFAYRRPDDRVAITNAAPKNDLVKSVGTVIGDQRILTDAEYKAHVLQSIPQDATDVIELPDDWTPPDRDRLYRRAWRMPEKGEFSVDLDEAKLLHVKRLERRGEITPETQAAIDAATTTEELRAVSAVAPSPVDVREL